MAVDWMKAQALRQHFQAVAMFFTGCTSSYKNRVAVGAALCSGLLSTGGKGCS
jgi:hypothetical protein